MTKLKSLAELIILKELLILKPLKHCCLHLIIFTLLISCYTNAQSRILQLTSFNMNISGTTNMHGFESKVTELNAQLVISNSNQIESLIVGIPVNSIKSGNKTMDSKTYHAFNVENFPRIIFKLTDSKVLNINNTMNISANGALSMNGKTKTINLKSNVIIISSGVYSCEGTLILNMTDFDMTPPTAFIGIMKVSDKITVNYNVTFKE